MSSVSFNQLNILFQNQERIDIVLDYLMFKNYPKYIQDTVDKRTAEEEKRKYRHKYRLFTLDSNKNIIYKPTNLRVVNEADVKDTLTEVFVSKPPQRLLSSIYIYIDANRRWGIIVRELVVPLRPHTFFLLYFFQKSI